MRKNLIFCLATIFCIAFPFLLTAEVKVYDDFEFVAERTGTGALAFVTAPTGKWTRAKAINTGAGAGACGYLYTTTSIPGFTGTFPGKSSSRVLCSEHLPETNDCYVGVNAKCPGSRWLQSDTYLGWGLSTQGDVPANTWIQFWMYINRYGDQISIPFEGKFLYSCGENTGGSTCPTGGMDWMGIFHHAQSYASFFETNDSSGSFYYSIDTQGHANFTGGAENTDKLGVNQGASAFRFDPNKWYLVKMNYDMRNASAPVFRMWVREQSESELTLQTEFIGGTTADLSWTAEYTSGQYWLTFLEMNMCYDMWIYFDDIAITDSESDLETYDSNSATAAGVTFSGASFY